MKKFFLLSLVFIVLLCLTSCEKNKEKEAVLENKTETVKSIAQEISVSEKDTALPENYYQFQMRKIPADIMHMENPCDLYSVYLYETETKSKHFVTYLYQEPVFLRDGFSWFLPGGGMFYEVMTEKNVLKLFYGETPEGKDVDGPWIEKEPEFEIKFSCDFGHKDLLNLEIPGFSRELKYDESKPNLYGEDVFYIQEILLAMTGITFYIDGKEVEFIPDGYFGKISEAAVKAYQKSKGLEQTGIVDKELWDFMTKKENITFN